MIRFLCAVPASAQSIRDDLWVTNGYVYTTTILDNTRLVSRILHDSFACPRPDPSSYSWPARPRMRTDQE